MWIFTKIGFFSAVQKTDELGTLQVRARVREDLMRLKVAVPGAGEILELPHRDYPYRVYMAQADWAGFCAGMAEGIDYPNFKDAVKKVSGHERARLYMGVWSTMNGAERKMAPKYTKTMKASPNNFDLVFGSGYTPERASAERVDDDGLQDFSDTWIASEAARDDRESSVSRRRRVVQHGVKKRKRGNGRVKRK